MKTHLENESRSIEKIAEELDTLQVTLDARHRQQRKTQFLLDVRGYFTVNQIAGNYVEFGIYRGEMTYSAFKILGHLPSFDKFVGLDTFAGEPAVSREERENNPYLKEGDFSADYETTNNFLSRSIKKPLHLIRGDFRDPRTMASLCDLGPIALCVVDCNLLSSIRSALDASLPLMAPGGFLFMDDYFINMGGGNCKTAEVLEEQMKAKNRKTIVYQTYPPCSRAFIVL